MVSDEELRRLYLVDHLSMQEIGVLLGRTRQAIHSRIRKSLSRAERDTAERFDVKCDLCGATYSITRKRFKVSERHFCSKGCYTKYMHNPDYKEWRNGQRIGRLVIEESLSRSLNYGEVVHHIDGDDSNNDLKNLIVFPSHSEHMKHHHKLREERLKARI